MKWRADMIFIDFKDLFYTNLSSTGDFNKAYLITEKQHEQMYNKRRYSDIESFRVQLSRRKKKE